MAQPTNFNIDGVNLTYFGPNNSIMHFTKEQTGEELIFDTSQMNVQDQITCLKVGSEFNKKEFQEVKAEQQQIRNEFKKMKAEINEMCAKFYGTSSISSHPNSNEIIEIDAQNSSTLFTKAKNLLSGAASTIKGFFLTSSHV